MVWAVLTAHLITPGFDFAWFRSLSSSTSVSSVFMVLWRASGTLRCLQKEMATYRHWSVSLQRDPDDISHCRILYPDKTEWRLISATLCGWRRCFVADQLWLMKRIWQEEFDSTNPAIWLPYFIKQMHFCLFPPTVTLWRNWISVLLMSCSSSQIMA